MEPIFLSNKYHRWYYNIIQNRLSTPVTGYTERHHIIPKSLGGSNSQSNLVALTAREHYLCHLLLVKMTEGSIRTAMLRAFNAFKMSSIKNSRHLTARQYQTLRTLTEGLPAWNNGKQHSPETRAKISAARKGQQSPMKGKQFSETARSNMSTAASNIDRRTKISQALKGRESPTKGTNRPYKPFSKQPCTHCGREISINNLSRHKC
jgi:DNA-binding CsgD family transcriptional regulator